MDAYASPRSPSATAEPEAPDSCAAWKISCAVKASCGVTHPRRSPRAPSRSARKAAHICRIASEKPNSQIPPAVLANADWLPTSTCSQSWRPERLYAVLQDIVHERPGPDGEPVPCDTWDNATIHADAGFPLTLATKRIAPREMNTWRLRALGMDGGIEFSTASPKVVKRFAVRDGRQLWEHLEVGSQSAFASTAGAIWEFGFSDAILQMWAAFLAEREGALGDRLGCVTPHEALTAHEIFNAAQESGASNSVVALGNR